MKVTILGSGAYGIALALMFNENKCDITLWEKFEEHAKQLRETRINDRVLPNVLIPKNIKITSDLEESIKNSELIVIAIPAGFVDEVAAELSKYIKKGQHICIATKGIEQDTCLFLYDVISSNIKTNNIAIISGGTFAIDIVKKVPVGLSIATKSSYAKNIVIITPIIIEFL